MRTLTTNDYKRINNVIENSFDSVYDYDTKRSNYEHTFEVELEDGIIVSVDCEVEDNVFDISEEDTNFYALDGFLALYVLSANAFDGNEDFEIDATPIINKVYA